MKPLIPSLLLLSLLASYSATALAQVWDPGINRPPLAKPHPTPVPSLPKPANSSNSPTFKLEAIVRKNLPPAMYGTWAIHAVVIRSDVPQDMYSPATEEIWTLQNADGVITLENVMNHASASIEVDEVSGNRATFHHAAIVPGEFTILETPTLTVSGDTIQGVNIQEVRLIEHNRVAMTYHLDIQITGQRLSGPRVTFGQTTQEANPHFEVAPLQYRK